MIPDFMIAAIHRRRRNEALGKTVMAATLLVLFILALIKFVASINASDYWPTTLRVDTDMDAFWLNNEERTCQTFPDTKGRVAIVSCNPGRAHGDHNIPVRFWGDVDRQTISDWKCRRESDQFVCRAIDWHHKGSADQLLQTLKEFAPEVGIARTGPIS